MKEIHQTCMESLQSPLIIDIIVYEVAEINFN